MQACDTARSSYTAVEKNAKKRQNTAVDSVSQDEIQPAARISLTYYVPLFIMLGSTMRYCRLHRMPAACTAFDVVWSIWLGRIRKTLDNESI